MTLTASRITKLGNRIRSGDLLPGDDRILGDFLLSFGPFAQSTYLAIIGLQSILDRELAPFGASISERSIKSSKSITDKLVRQPSLRLDQLQDIVGCRIVVLDQGNQDRVLELLRSVFDDLSVKDRREEPTFGYRAIHAIVRVSQQRYEIQIRTVTQHLWATLVELLIAKHGIDIKYGGGPLAVQAKLARLSDAIASFEAAGSTDPKLFGAFATLYDEIEGTLGDIQS